MDTTLHRGSGRATPMPAPAPAGWSVLVLNCEPSSIRFALFDAAGAQLPRQPIWAGQVAGIGGRRPELVQDGSPNTALVLDAQQSYQAALRHVRATAVAQTGGRPPAAVVHRLAHAGAKCAAPVLVDRAVLSDLEGCVALAPLHQRFALQAIAMLLADVPDLLQVACFDSVDSSASSAACVAVEPTHDEWIAAAHALPFIKAAKANAADHAFGG